MRKKRIAITQSKLNMGGIQKTLINYLNLLNFEENQVDLYLSDLGGELTSEVPEQVNIIKIEFKKIYENKFINKAATFLFRGASYRYVFQNVPNTQYDCSIAFDGYTSSSDYFALSLKSSQSLVWVHSDYKERSNKDKGFKLKLKVMRSKYLLFDKIIAVSESSSSSFCELYPHVASKVFVCGNPVFTNKIGKSTIQLQQDVFNIISVGALLPVKGFERLIAIHTKLISLGLNVHTTLVGSGPQYDELSALVSQHQIEDSFFLVGQINDVQNILVQADLYVMTSFYEGYPGVLIESLAVGLPLIVPEISGAVDIAKYIAPENMATITENSVDSMTKAIQNYIETDKFILTPINTESYNESIINKLKSIIKV